MRRKASILTDRPDAPLMFTMPLLVSAERQDTPQWTNLSDQFQAESTAKDIIQQSASPLATATLPRLEPELSDQRRFCFGHRTP
jgi:hypothetical protein